MDNQFARIFNLGTVDSYKSSQVRVILFLRSPHVCFILVLILISMFLR